ncbi:MAG TPA: carotenoid biosynthesis protein [Fimbriimonas sp.]|nr:carotenoid biosynthesis protein [Fimbriimonas sp.]
MNAGPIAPIASFATLAMGCWIAFSCYVSSQGPARVLAVLGLGAACEVLGLATGLPFGRYQYTGRWWPSLTISGLGPFPLLLPFAWLLIAGSAYLLASTFFRDRFPAVVLGALIATATDLVMEPAMTGTLGYWRWLERGALPGGAPLLNPMGWFVTSLLAGLLLGKSDGTWKGPAIALAGQLALILGFQIPL